jgi:hypothetical protein
MVACIAKEERLTMMYLIFILIFLAWSLAPTFLRDTPFAKYAFPFFLGLCAAWVVVQTKRDPGSIQRLFEKQYGNRKGRIVFLVLLALTLATGFFAIDSYFRTLGAVRQIGRPPELQP